MNRTEQIVELIEIALMETSDLHLTLVLTSLKCKIQALPEPSECKHDDTAFIESIAA